MTTTIERSDSSASPPTSPRGPGGRPLAPWLGDHVVAITAVSAIALRLPMLRDAPGLDEGGYLMVAAQWHAGGSSLFGNYWVDRPPMLMLIFGAASHLGGLVTLRLIGCLAAALVVLGAAYLARLVAGQMVDAPQQRVAGARAAKWAAIVAAALCVSPWMGATEVNGELLAAPFVVWGIAAAVVSISRITNGARHPLRPAAAAGAAMVAAVLVKQNFVDLGVFMVTALALSAIRRDMTIRDAARIGASFGAGAAACLVVVSGWTLLLGTSLTGVYDAMYPFRIAATSVLSASDPARDVRRATLLRSALLSGLPMAMGLTLGALVSRRVRSTALWALLAVFVYDLISIRLGVSYWPHYLMQTVVPVAVCAGVLAALRQPRIRALARGVAAAVATLGVIAWAQFVPGSTTSDGSSIGQAIRAVSLTRDTIVTMYGHSDVSEESGLSSPYPYLWSLPARVFDPKLHALDDVLAGPRAPTWLVTWTPISTWGAGGVGTEQVVAERYQQVAQFWGHAVYLRDGFRRVVPRTASP